MLWKRARRSDNVVSGGSGGGRGGNDLAGAGLNIGKSAADRKKSPDFAGLFFWSWRWPRISRG